MNKYIILAFGLILLTSTRNLTKAQSMNWIDVGIQNSVQGQSGIGRVDHIAFDPNNEDKMYACSPWGGVFKSVDKGLTWSTMRLEHKVEQPAASFLHVDPEVLIGTTLYVASGNADGPFKNPYQRESVGIYRTTNGGSSWIPIGPFEKENCDLKVQVEGKDRHVGFQINTILQGPDSRAHLIICTTCGIYETKNSLASNPTWTRIIEGSFGALVMQPGTSTIFCAENLVSNPRIIMYDLDTNSETEINYTASSATGINITHNYVRINLRFSKSTSFSDYLFIFFSDHLDDGDSHEGQIYLYRINTHDYIDKGSRNLGGVNRFDGVHVSDLNADNVYLPSGSGIGTPQMTTNGTNGLPFNYQGISNTAVHPDQHYITQSPHDNVIWIANDGGIYELNSTDFVERMSGLAVSTIDAFDVAQLKDQTRYVAGYQDMGSQITDFDELLEEDLSINFRWGDGDGNVFNPFDYNIFSAGASGNIVSYHEQNPVSKDVSRLFWSSSIRGDHYYDPKNEGVIFDLVDEVLHRSDDGGRTTIPWCPHDDISSFAISPTQPNIMYCISKDANDGKAILYKSTSGGGNSTTNWSEHKFGDANFNASNPVVDYDNPHHIWIAGSWPQVLYSLNTKTMALTSMSGENNYPFPNWEGAQLASVVNEKNSNQAMYVVLNNISGSDYCTKGIYYTDLTLEGNWINVGAGLPRITKKKIALNDVSQEIYAGTYGRGMWKSNTYCSALSGDKYIVNDLNDKSYHFSGQIRINKHVGGLVTLRSGEEVQLNSGFETETGCDFTAIAKACNSSGSTKAYANDVEYNDNLVTQKNALSSNDPDEMSFENVVSVWPNPTDGIFVVSMKEHENVELSVIDIYGKTCISKNTNDIYTEFDISHLSKGVYFISVKSINGTYSSKLVLE